eukprot:1767101-Pyramimonas_sp.AAC.1
MSAPCRSRIHRAFFGPSSATASWGAQDWGGDGMEKYEGCGSHDVWAARVMYAVEVRAQAMHPFHFQDESTIPLVLLPALLFLRGQE